MRFVLIRECSATARKCCVIGKAAIYSNTTCAIYKQSRLIFVECIYLHATSRVWQKKTLLFQSK